MEHHGHSAELFSLMIRWLPMPPARGSWASKPDRVVHIREASKFLGNSSSTLVDFVGEGVQSPEEPFHVVPEFEFLRQRLRHRSLERCRKDGDVGGRQKNAVAQMRYSTYPHVNAVFVTNPTKTNIFRPLRVLRVFRVCIVVHTYGCNQRRAQPALLLPKE
jgi:hypothetical protein